MSHERARRLAAVRLDQALPPNDEAALEAHLEGCADCRSVAAGYEADRLALRAMPPIEPPRDLWARTSAALEREHARHPRVIRRVPRRWGPVAILGSGFALVLVIALVGPTLLGSGTTTAGALAVASNSVGPAAPSGPVDTPLNVASTEVTWVVTKGPGSLSLVTADVNKVCATGDEPDCPPLAGISRSLANLPTVPSSLVLSPSNASQAVAIGPAPDKVGNTLFVMVVPSAPPPSQAPSALPQSSGGPRSSPGATASPSVAASPPSGSSPTPATATPTPVESSGAATPTPGASQLGSSPLATASPPPPGSPAPSAAASLAILSNVTLVGDEAAYSGDGQWFAFSARPADTSTGPDIYVWRAGWQTAQPITSDHGSVFSGWVDGRILASRAVPIVPGGSPTPDASGGPGGSPASSAGSTAVPQPSLPAASPSDAAGAQPSTGSNGSALVQASPAATSELATPAAYLLDPASGQATRIAGLDGWRPVVDPSGQWVAYWAGTLSFDPASGMWQPFAGQLQVASWAIVSAAADAPTGAAAAHPLPLDAGTDWDLRWDRTGEHLGVWVADEANPGLGSLSLLTIDPASGQTSSAPPALALDTPALRGFALRDGQLVWATPPGQDGVGSRLYVLAWTGANAGKTSVSPIDDGALIVVP